MFRPTTRNDLSLPSYAPFNADTPWSAGTRLQLEQGGVDDSNTLAIYAPRMHPVARPRPGFQIINQSPTLPRYRPRAWTQTQGGYLPLGATETPQYGIGELAMAGTAGLVVGMLLTYLWYQSK